MEVCALRVFSKVHRTHGTELWSAPRLHGALSYFTTLINSPSLDNFVLHFYTVIILSDVLTLCVFTAAAR